MKVSVSIVLGSSDIQLLNVFEICLSVPDPQGKRNQKISRRRSSLILRSLLYQLWTSQAKLAGSWG